MRLSAHSVILLILLIDARIYISVEAALSRYHTTPGAVKSTNYKIQVDDQDIPVESFLDVDVVRFKLTGPAKVRLFSKHGLAGVTLLPDYEPYIPRRVEKFNTEPTLRFFLNGPTKLVITIPGTRQLFFFADPPISHEPKPGNDDVTSLDEYATPNSTEVQTSKIQKAIDAVAKHGGTLYVPPGKYRSGMLRMKSNVRLWLSDGAVIQGTADPKDYTLLPDVGKRTVQILFHSVKNASIDGRGVIDGNGVEMVAKHGRHVRPHLCVTFLSSDIHIEHAIIYNSASFNVHIISSHNVVVNDIAVISNRERLFDHEGDLNTDGIDVANSHDVRVINPFVYNGDDGVCIKVDAKSTPSETRNVLLSGGIILSHADATKVGTGAGQGIVENIVFRDTHILYSHRAMGLISRGGCTYRNITWKNIDINTPVQMLDIWMDKEAGNYDHITYDDVRTINYYPVHHVKTDKPTVNGLDSKHTINNIVFNKFSVNGHIWKSKDDAKTYGQVTFGEFVSNLKFKSADKSDYE